VCVHEVGQKFFGEIVLANTTYTPPSKYPDCVALDNVNRIILLLGILNVYVYFINTIYMEYGRLRPRTTRLRRNGNYCYD